MPYIPIAERIGMGIGQDEGFKQGFKQGLEQGRAEGEAALRKMVREILESRFKGVPSSIQERLGVCSGLEVLQSLGRLALAAESLDEFLEGLQSQS